jgi:hypothetical protein
MVTIAVIALTILATLSVFAGFMYVLGYYPHVKMVHHDVVIIAFFLLGIFFVLIAILIKLALP